MIVALMGIVLGLVIGFYLPVTFPAQYSLYFSISIIAAFDSVFGAVRANMENKFDSVIFITGFFGNAFLAGMLAYIGDQLGVPLYYAAIVAFGVRLFENFAFIRRHIIAKFREGAQQ